MLSTRFLSKVVTHCNIYFYVLTMTSGDQENSLDSTINVQTRNWIPIVHLFVPYPVPMGARPGQELGDQPA